MTLGGYFDDFGSFCEHFWLIFRALHQFEHPDDPQGPQVILGTQSHIKSVKSRLWNQ